jgi:hypothetical protein
MAYGAFIALSIPAFAGTSLPGERFGHIELTDEKGGERLDCTPVAQEDILIAGKLTFIVSVKRSLSVFFIPILWRMSWSRAPMSLCVQAGKGRAGSARMASRSMLVPVKTGILAALKGAESVGVLDRPIRIGRKRAKPLALRLVAFRKPPAAAEASRAKARRAARREGNVILGGTLAAAEWVILVTSLKAEAWSSARIGELYRARWRIEACPRADGDGI